MKFKYFGLISLLLLCVLCLSACSNKQLKEFGKGVGESYNCQEGNENRPDAAQRQAECQQRQNSSGF